MKFVWVFVGFMVFLFLYPMFRTIWDNIILPLRDASGIDNPHVLIFFTLVPWAIIAVVVIAAFLILRQRGEQ